MTSKIYCSIKSTESERENKNAARRFHHVLELIKFIKREVEKKTSHLIIINLHGLQQPDTKYVVRC